MKKWIVIIAAVLIAVIGTFAVMHKVSPLSWGLWGNVNNASGVAIKGYDPVAYFKDSKPTQGNSQYSVEWGGVSWQFANAENKELFARSPDSYAPQFGGFCAFAVSKGFTADSSPDAWHIEGDKLYLFADGNVQKDWVADVGPDLLEKASTHWAKR